VSFGEICRVSVTLALEGSVRKGVQHGVSEDGFAEAGVEPSQRECVPKLSFICAGRPLTLALQSCTLLATGKSYSFDEGSGPRMHLRQT